jgi:hypothetical protein
LPDDPKFNYTSRADFFRKFRFKHYL